MKTLSQDQKYLQPVLVLEHLIEANQTQVFKAWTDIELFQKWFCPTGFTIAKAEMDCRPGGYFRVHMKSPEGEIYPTKGEYISIEKPNRIVYKDSWDDDRTGNEPIVTEVIFEAVDDKTNLKLYSSFASESQKEKVLSQGIIEGWKMFFRNLNEL